MTSVTPAPAVSHADFADARALYERRSFGSLLFNWSILRLCGMPLFVKAAPRVFELCKNTLLEPAVMAVTRQTFFKQFCAGETIEKSTDALDAMHLSRMHAILEYRHYFDLAGANTL
jgi:proline dehydrogenase